MSSCLFQIHSPWFNGGDTVSKSNACHYILYINIFSTETHTHTCMWCVSSTQNGIRIPNKLVSKIIFHLTILHKLNIRVCEFLLATISFATWDTIWCWFYLACCRDCVCVHVCMCAENLVSIGLVCIYYVVVVVVVLVFFAQDKINIYTNRIGRHPIYAFFIFMYKFIY